jgi:hypothetical protein
MPPSLTIQKDDLDKRPPLPPRSPHAIISGADWTERTPPPLVALLPWPAWVVFGVVVLILIGLVVWWVVRWAARNPELAELGQLFIMTLLFVLAVAGVAWALVALYFNLMARWGQSLTYLFSRSRLGNLQPLHTMAAQSLDDVIAFEAAANTLEIKRAPYTRYPVLASLTEGDHEEAQTTINALGGDDESPAGVPSADWLRWIDETPHLMIAGRTNAGKTTLASAILAERIQAGDDVLVIDPHDQPDKWFGVQAVGGGRQYGEILATLARVVEEMDTRYQAFNSGTPTSAFTRLTVLVDEVPAIMDACLNEKRRVVDARWSNFARQLGSEARKVRISVVLMTQSVLVQDIGINTAMRKNFSRIALGDEVRRLLSEEANSERRTTLTELVRGQAHPAVMEYRGEIHVLNTADVPALAQQDVRHLVSVWNYTRPIAPDPSVSVQTDSRQTWDRMKKQAVVAQLRAAGLTREQARARLAKVGQGLDNDDWAAADPSRIEAL